MEDGGSTSDAEKQIDGGSTADWRWLNGGLAADRPWCGGSTKMTVYGGLCVFFCVCVLMILCVFIWVFCVIDERENELEWDNVYIFALAL